VRRSAAEDPFLTTAESAAAPLLPNVPAREPDAPGQSAFANDRRVYTTLEGSGWAEIDIRPIDVACTLPEKELVRYLTRLSPVAASCKRRTTVPARKSSRRSAPPDCKSRKPRGAVRLAKIPCACSRKPWRGCGR
jgi:hypothetical protein